MITNGYILLTKEVFVSAAEVMDKVNNIPFNAAILHGLTVTKKYKLGYSGAISDFLYHHISRDSPLYVRNSPETVLLLLFLGEIVGDEGIKYRCWY
jgi:hypothetical protein